MQQHVQHHQALAAHQVLPICRKSPAIRSGQRHITAVIITIQAMEAPTLFMHVWKIHQILKEQVFQTVAVQQIFCM